MIRQTGVAKLLTDQKANQKIGIVDTKLYEINHDLRSPNYPTTANGRSH